jgi:hypothetical protein
MALDFVDLMQQAKRVLAFTGAGISTESGIPDFRSPGGIWSQSQPVYYDQFLRSQAARNEYWRQKSVAHRDFAAAQPNPGHRVLAQWEGQGRLRGVPAAMASRGGSGVVCRTETGPGLSRLWPTPQARDHFVRSVARSRGPGTGLGMGLPVRSHSGTRFIAGSAAGGGDTRVGPELRRTAGDHQSRSHPPRSPGRSGNAHPAGGDARSSCASVAGTQHIKNRAVGTSLHRAVTVCLRPVFLRTGGSRNYDFASCRST